MSPRDQLRYTKNPSEATKLAAVQDDGLAIHMIKNPSKELQLAAVREDSLAILAIQNPSLHVRAAALWSKLIYRMRWQKTKTVMRNLRILRRESL